MITLHAMAPDVDAVAQASLSAWLDDHLREEDRRGLARAVCDLRRGAGAVLVLAGHPGAGHWMLRRMLDALVRGRETSTLALEGAPVAHTVHLAMAGAHQDRLAVVGAGLASLLVRRTTAAADALLGLLPEPDARAPWSLTLTYEGRGWDTPPAGVTQITLHRPRAEDPRRALHARAGDLAAWARNQGQ